MNLLKPTPVSNSPHNHFVILQKNLNGIYAKENALFRHAVRPWRLQMGRDQNVDSNNNDNTIDTTNLSENEQGTASDIPCSHTHSIDWNKMKCFMLKIPSQSNKPVFFEVKRYM